MLRGYKIYITVFIILFSNLEVYGFQIKEPLFKVLKIKEVGDYYVIKLKRNDSLFKIISKKVTLNETKELKLLKVGLCYQFDFYKKDGGPMQVVEPIVGIVNNLDVKKSKYFIDGDTRIKFSKRFHFRLYIAQNLSGLYYSPPAF